MLLLSCLSFIFSAHWKIIAIICHPSRLFYLFHALFELFFVSLYLLLSAVVSVVIAVIVGVVFWPSSLLLLVLFFVFFLFFCRFAVLPHRWCYFCNYCCYRLSYLWYCECFLIFFSHAVRPLPVFRWNECELCSIILNLFCVCVCVMQRISSAPFHICVLRTYLAYASLWMTFFSAYCYYSS